MTCDPQCRVGDMKIKIDTRLIPRIRELEKENERLRKALEDRYRDIDFCEISSIVGSVHGCYFCDGQQECLDYPFVQVSARVYKEYKQ